MYKSDILKQLQYWTDMVIGMVWFLQNVLKFASHFRYKEKKRKRSKQERRGKYLNSQENQNIFFYNP